MENQDIILKLTKEQVEYIKGKVVMDLEVLDPNDPDGQELYNQIDDIGLQLDI